MAGLLLALPLVLAAGGINPYAPLPGWSYALEAAGRLPWPSCPDRYVGAGNDAGADYVSLFDEEGGGFGR